MQDLASQFLTFCRSKPADEGYTFTDSTACACGQFAYSLGWDGEDYDSELRAACEPPEICDAAGTRPHTFGALADRLEAALQKARVQ